MNYSYFKTPKENRRSILFFFSAVLIFLVILVMLAPHQIIHSNSVSGFQALAGWQNSGHFNCIITPDHKDISKFNTSFLTWWTPGQYIFPFLVQSVLHISLGNAVVIVNFICTFLGLIGFYKIFSVYGFETDIMIMSLLLILTSNTVLFRFISYQGGESISFLVFPWIVYTFIITKRSFLRALLVVPFLILGFMVKSQMLIALIPLFLIITLTNPVKTFVNDHKYSIDFKKELYAAAATIMAIVFSIALLYGFFISKGDNPAQVSHFNISPMYILKPLAAPLTAIADVSHLFFMLGTKHFLAEVILFAASIAVVFYAFTKSDLGNKYNLMVFVYYIITVNTFIFLYVSGADIDQNVRHFKFVAFLFFPVLLLAFKNTIPVSAIKFAVAAIVCFSLVNHVSQRKISFNNTYVAQNDCRLPIDEFPLSLHNYMLRVKGTETHLFFSPFDPRWATGRSNFICVDNQSMKPYYGHGDPVWYVQEMESDDVTAICKYFPGYKLEFTKRFEKYLLVKLR